MAENKCQFCGAALDTTVDHLVLAWRCGSVPENSGPWQSETCKLIVAEATIERLEEELRRRE